MSQNLDHITGQVVQFGTLTVKPGTADDISQNLKELTVFVKANEPYVLEWSFARYGDTFAIWERYENKEAKEKHAEAAPVKAFLVKLYAALLEPPKFQVFPGEL